MSRFLFSFKGASCLREVSLEVVPEVVQRGKEAILRCHYDLEKAPLYSLKWYRGRHEFYRFSPSEDPATKIFNISGIYVDVSCFRTPSLESSGFQCRTLQNRKFYRTRFPPSPSLLPFRICIRICIAAWFSVVFATARCGRAVCFQNNSSSKVKTFAAKYF